MVYEFQNAIQPWKIGYIYDQKACRTKNPKEFRSY